MSRQVFYGTILFAAVACSTTVLSMMTHAPSARYAYGRRVEGIEAGKNVSIMFTQDTFARNVEDPFAPMSRKIEKYTSALWTGTGINGEARIEINGLLYYVPATSFVSDSVQIADLENQRVQEEKEQAQKELEEAQRKKELEIQQKEQVQKEEFQEEVQLIQILIQNAWSGSVLNRTSGVNDGPSGKETYYNLPMQGVVNIMRAMGNTDEYWVRSDGVKMLGEYVMVAAHLGLRPRGSLIETSLGMGIVCDTGEFALDNPTQLDIAVDWK